MLNGGKEAQSQATKGLSHESIILFHIKIIELSSLATVIYEIRLEGL